MRVSYRDASGGARVTVGTLGPDGQFRDPDGKVIGRLIKGVGVAVSLATLTDIARNDGPDLCPKPPVPDRNGARAADRDYEDFVKRIVNPDNPTPRAMGYSLPNPTMKTGAIIFDDCEHKTGTMIEAKGNYANLIRKLGVKDNFWLRAQWTKQATNQIAAAKDRPIMWFFKELVGAHFARDLFDKKESIQGRIQTVYLPN
jgi:hypothetical protein